MTKIDIQRILCPTDFSAISVHAFEHAAALAAWHQAALTVLHVQPDTVAPVSELAYMADAMLLGSPLREAVEAELSSVVAPARRVGLRADGELREGRPAIEIVRAAQERHADLIVMGTHGRSGFQRWVLGSVAETVLRRAQCPVLTVPARAGELTDPMFFKRILCATDFSPASEAAVGYAASMAEESNAMLVLVHVVERPEPGAHSRQRLDGGGGRGGIHQAAQAQLRRARPEARGGGPSEEIVTCGKVAPEILRLAAERKTGLIVVGVHGRNLRDLMAFGSVTHQVVREAICPVIAVRPPRQ